MSTIRPQLAHLGIYVIDLDAMERFYSQVFGLTVTDRGMGAIFRNQLVFMSSAPDQHHQLVLSTGRASGSPSMIMQLSFKLDTLDELRQIKELAQANGGTEMMELNHGNAWSIYFFDPEGNRIEIYLDTPFHTPQPCGHPLDLALSDDEIFEKTRKLIEELPGSLSMADYAALREAELSA